MNIEDFDLSEVLEQPTQSRREEINPEPTFVEETKTFQEPSSFGNLEFEPLPAREEQPLELLSPYDAEENAEILVELIDVINIQTLTPLARWKLARSRKIKKQLPEIKVLAERYADKQELTDEEKKRIAFYKAYLKDKEEIESAIPYTKDEKEALKTAVIPYLTAHQLKIGGGMAFWTQLAMIQGSRIINVLTA